MKQLVVRESDDPQRSLFASRCIAAALLSAAVLLSCNDKPAANTKCNAQTGEGCPVENPPRLGMEPPFGMGFSCTTLGCDEEKPLLVTNRGGGTLRLSLARLAVDASTDFKLRRADDEQLPTPEHQFAIPAGETLELRVRYTPSDAVEDAGALVFETSDAGKAYTDQASRTDQIPLTTRSLGAPEAALTTPTLDFGYVAVGATAELALRVAHVGEQSILGFGPITANEGCVAFREASFGDWNTRFINPGTDASVTVVYAPTTPDASLCTLQIPTNDPLSPLLEVAVRGTAIPDPRLLVLEPDDGALHMADVRAGTSRTRPIRIMNLGGGALDFAPAVVAGAERGLVLGPLQQTQLAPLQEASFDVVLNATGGGALLGQVDINSNDATAPLRSILVDALITEPLIVVEPEATDFGGIVLGWQSDPRTVMVRNAGVGELTITGISLELGSSDNIHLTNVPELPMKLSAGDAPLTFSLYVTANGLGTHNAVVLIESDAVNAAAVRHNVTARVITCDEGCPTPNGVPDCSTGRCEIGSCVTGFHNADSNAATGCECREDTIGNTTADIPGACPGVSLGSLSDDDGGLDMVGTLHDMNDVDMYFYYANDDFQWFDDEYGARVQLLEAPPGLMICGNFQDPNQGCGGLPTYCSFSEVRGHDNADVDDDDESVTVWVMWAQDASPQCGNYRVHFEADAGF